MKKLKKMICVLVAACSVLSLASCGTHYCSYGGCMRTVENEGDRCSEHQGKPNDPNYGLPDSWKSK